MIGLRLYTGPMFMVFNTALRALGDTQQKGLVPVYDTNWSGQDVSGRFVSTLHAINHGCIKFSRLSVAKEVHRSFAGMKLPESFSVADVNNVKGGGEFGFMSTTASRDVALEYTKGQAEGTPRTLLTAKMNMASRGAYLGFISQYPGEVDFLYAPLCGLEVRAEPVLKAAVITYDMDFHTNNTICSADGASADVDKIASLPDLLNSLPPDCAAEDFVALADPDMVKMQEDLKLGLNLMQRKALAGKVREWVGRRRTLHLRLEATDGECAAAEARRETLHLAMEATNDECAAAEAAEAEAAAGVAEAAAQAKRVRLCGHSALRPTVLSACRLFRANNVTD